MICLSAMSEDEFKKASEFHQLLKYLTKGSKGILPIDREKFVKMASAYLEMDLKSTNSLLLKMQKYGLIEIKQDYVAVH
ncbi:MAG: hypothetical protein OWQ50_05110 [Acidianus infernus]|nr:hypothetical protein [Acidianus infernus]